jgi:hypothetical protein
MSTGVERETQSLTRDDDRCVRCGYDLRGIADDHPCSECGLLAERSRNRSEYLADVPPWLIRRLAIGARLLLWSVLCLIGWMILSTVGRELIYAAFAGRTYHLRLAGYDLAVALWILGSWLLTTRGSPAHVAMMPQRLRFSCRVVSLLMLGIVAMMHLQMDWLSRPRLVRWTPLGRPPVWKLLLDDFLPYLIIGSGWFVLSLNSVLCFLWLRKLAQRVLNSNLAEHSAIVGVGVAASSGALVLFGIAQPWLQKVQPFANKTWAYLMLVGLVTILACLMTCVIWSLTNLVRFSFAFRKASRESRARWDRADRARQVQPTDSGRE